TPASIRFRWLRSLCSAPFVETISCNDNRLFSLSRSFPAADPILKGDDDALGGCASRELGLHRQEPCLHRPRPMAVPDNRGITAHCRIAGGQSKPRETSHLLQE